MSLRFVIDDDFTVEAEHECVVEPTVVVAERFAAHVFAYDELGKISARAIGKRISSTESGIDLDADDIAVVGAEEKL